MTRTYGVLRSPGYPRAYGSNQRCTWHISAPRGFQIRLKFRRQFHIQTSSSCTKDYLMLAQSRHFRSPLIFCGKNRPMGILTPRNNLWVRFQSDSNGSAKGFLASYVAVGKLVHHGSACVQYSQDKKRGRGRVRVWFGEGGCGLRKMSFICYFLV